MVRKKIDKLLNNLTYTAYKKYYGIEDKPFKKMKVYLSDKQNNWNSTALFVNPIIKNINDFTILSNEKVNISIKNNLWNKRAIGMEDIEDDCT